MAAKWHNMKDLKPVLVEQVKSLKELLIKRHAIEMEKHLQGIKMLIEMEKHKKNGN